jgi:asparagine synthase (glutamine-hydrolysing)
MTHFQCICHRSRSTGYSLEQRLEQRVFDVSPGLSLAVGSSQAVARIATADRALIAIGNVRLDDGIELARRVGASPQADDLEVLLHHFALEDVGCFRNLDGDFAVVIGDSHGRIILARDPFGVYQLFYNPSSERIAISTTASGAADDPMRMEMGYIADFLVNGSGPSTSTIYHGVRPVAPGSFIAVTGQTLNETQYWSQQDIGEDSKIDEQDAIDQFRTLFFRSVANRMAGAGATWAHLSGGLDSSSIVCAAEFMARNGSTPHRLAGTLTLTDNLGDGDEAVYVDAVLRDYPSVNERVTDWWPWQGDELVPELPDQPTGTEPMYRRDRYIRDRLRAVGCKVMLSGHGSDHYLSGSLMYLADLVARGHLLAASHDSMTWAVEKRCSVYDVIKSSIVMPLTPRWLRPGRRSRSAGPPQWLDDDFVRRYELKTRRLASEMYAGSPGSQFQAARKFEIREVSRGLTIDQHGLEHRYPFLSRRLVEFALSLPARLIIRPHARKWILRSAMQGVLPDEVRVRRGKGGVGARIRWALNAESARIATLTESPILEELGCIRGDMLRRAVKRVQSGRRRRMVDLYATLALETWLQLRSGRWPERAMAA